MSLLLLLKLCVSNKSQDVHITSGQSSKMTPCLADLFYQKHPKKQKNKKLISVRNTTK
jgi:hypothetical protein